MSKSCCDNKTPELQKIAKDQSRVLWIVLLINLSMFCIEIGSGLYASSTALLGDSLDMLGDSLAYGASLYVVNLGISAKAKAANLKAWIILLSSVTVLSTAIYRTFFREVPTAEIMGVVGALALIANLICLILLTRHRDADVNMASVWICSRNDIIANCSVLVAAGVVKITGSPWADLLVGCGLAILFTKSAFHIFAASRRSLLEENAVIS